MIETLKKIFIKQEDLFLFAYLFGSRAKQFHTKSSDIDIAIFINNTIEHDYFDIKTDLYLTINRALKQNNIDIVIMNQCKNIILLNQIITHGKLICDNNPSQRIDYEQKIFHHAIGFKTQRKIIMGI